VGYLLLGLLGVAITLVGFFTHVMWLVPVGPVLVIASVLLFVRRGSSAPVRTDSRRP
jgi:hypothetical protein